jgi:hypothetical protein
LEIQDQPLRSIFDTFKKFLFKSRGRIGIQAAVQAEHAVVIMLCLGNIHSFLLASLPSPGLRRFSQFP